MNELWLEHIKKGCPVIIFSFPFTLKNTPVNNKVSLAKTFISLNAVGNRSSLAKRNLKTGYSTISIRENMNKK